MTLEVPDIQYTRSGDVAIAYQVLGDGPVDIVWFRGTGSADYPWAPTEEEWRRRLASVRAGWGQREFFEELLREWAPSLAEDDDFKEWFVGHMRRSLSPGAALAFFRTMKDADVSDILSSVGVPTLIHCKPRQRAEAEYVSARIPGSEIAELAGLDGLFTWIDDEVHAQTMRETERFLARIGRPKEPDRVLATVLFTDIVGSTERSAELGNTAWRTLLERHHTLVRRRLAQFD